MNKAGKGKAFQKELHKLSDMFKERLIFFFVWSVSSERNVRHILFLSNIFLFTSAQLISTVKNQDLVLQLMK